MPRGAATLGVRIAVETDADIGTPEFVDAFLGLCARFPRWTPERFGAGEPLRHRLTPDARETFQTLWQGRVIRPGYAVSNLILARRSAVAYRGVVSWTRGQGTLNRIGLATRLARSQAAAEEALEFAIALFGAMRGQFGFAASDDEHYAKNVSGWWINPATGKPQGGKARAPDRTRHLPGVYWATLFGPAYVALFGDSKLETAPAARRDRVPGSGWLIVTAHAPDDWNLQETGRLQEDLIEYLGREAFFDPQNPERRGMAPRFERVRTIGGMLGGVSNQPVSTEFFSSPADVSEFLAQTLELTARLRRRLRHGSRLDYSPRSLEAVEKHILRRVQRRSVREDRDLALEVAAYYGETLRRNLGGRWTVALNDPLMPVVEVADPPTVEYPLVRATKLWEDGSSLLEWYDFVAKGGEGLLT